jgi:thermitase
LCDVSEEIMGYQYRVGGKIVDLESDPDLIGVRYTEPAPHSLRAAFSQKIGADLADRVEIENEKFTLLKTPSASPSSVTESVESAVSVDNTGIMRTAPVFKVGNTRVLATDRILIGLKNHDDVVVDTLQGINYQKIEPRGHGEFTVTLAPDVDPLSVASRLENNPSLSYVEPDFVNVTNPMHSAPSQVLEVPTAGDLSTDLTYNPDQYAISLTQAHLAWKLKTGTGDVIIAVLDEGIDTRHPDLKDCIMRGYDASDKDSFQEPNPWDGHGTACAGLAAAMPLAAGGVRGIGGGCSLFAVRIAYSTRPHGPWITSNGQIGEAVDWSWQNGASVISNSWGGGAPSTAISNAFQRAQEKGRDGKGCVIVVAAGNDAGPVSFPATLPNVLCVAASTPDDEPKRKHGDDGEPWWGSNFGAEVSIAAPGIRNFTTDITGPSGYNPNGNYTATFNGTSSATPLVAGACGLVLSANPALTGEEVCDVIKRTADQVGTGLIYQDGRNDYMGFGRLNVLNAVRLVLH